MGRILPVSRTHDSHTQLLLVGTAGLGAVLVSDWAWLVLLDHRPALTAALDAARVVATVGPGPTETSAAHAAFSTTAILVTVVLTAMFTAGLVQRLLEPGLLGLVGKRRAPRSGHVVVVGMGQVGVRLCAELRRLGVPVVGVERAPTAPQLRLARALKIPVVVGHGVDRAGLERLRLDRSIALAAVGSNESDNIAVAIAASAVSPRTRVVLRAGEQEAIAETRSMLPLGTTTDVLRLTASAIVHAMCRGGSALDPARHETTAAPGRRDCIHLAW
ncbi:MAG: NAD-binding protein [Nocardioides sp.]|nr:NAD-binding protein [Nocardioides sp.]